MFGMRIYQVVSFFGGLHMKSRLIRSNLITLHDLESNKPSAQSTDRRQTEICFFKNHLRISSLAKSIAMV